MSKKTMWTIEEALHLGDQITSETIADYQSGNSAGVRLSGIPELADLLPPGKPSNLIGICGVSGSMKSTIMSIMMVSRARQLMEDGDPNKVIVAVSFEESVGTLAQRLMSKYMGVSLTDLTLGKITQAHFDEIKTEAYAKMSGLPIYIIAPDDSYDSDDDSGTFKMRDNTRSSSACESIVKSLEYMYNVMGLRVDSLWIDYLQNMVSQATSGTGMSEKQKIDYHINWSIDLAGSFNTCVVLASQASTKEYDNLSAIPLGRSASKGSTVFGERCDIMYTLANMTKYISEIPEDDVIKGINGYPYLEYQDNLFLLTVAKSKKTEELTVPLLVDPSNMTWQLSYQYFQSQYADRHGHSYDKSVHQVWR